MFVVVPMVPLLVVSEPSLALLFMAAMRGESVLAADLGGGGGPISASVSGSGDIDSLSECSRAIGMDREMASPCSA